MNSDFRIKILGGEMRDVPETVSSLASDVSHEMYDLEKILEPFTENPDLILCFSPNGLIPEVEIAQSLRMNYPEVAIYYLAFNRNHLNKKNLLKNGFTEVFLLPWELADLTKSVRDISLNWNPPQVVDHFPVEVSDLIVKSVLTFPTKIFLEKNNKFVQFSSLGESIEEEKLLRLKDNKITTVYIDNEDQEKYDKFLLESNNKSPNHVERTKSLFKVARELVSEMLVEESTENTFEKSKQLMNEVRVLVKQMAQYKDQKLSSALSLFISKESNFYSHLVNTCIYAYLFSMCLKEGDPEEVGIAGLFHDIGKMNQNATVLDANDKSERYRHPQYTIDMIKEKRMIVSEIAMKAILQHHESCDGTGFPKGLNSSKISVEAKILAIADSFEKLTSKSAEVMNPMEALEKLMSDNKIGSPNIVLDTGLMKKILNELRR